jgi:hypothetical protein
MDFIISVKDELIQGLGTLFGNPNKPEEAIQAKLQSVIDIEIPDVVKRYDPEVLALSAALDLKLQEKIDATKEIIKGK